MSFTAYPLPYTRNCVLQLFTTNSWMHTYLALTMKFSTFIEIMLYCCYTEDPSLSSKHCLEDLEFQTQTQSVSKSFPSKTNEAPPPYSSCPTQWKYTIHVIQAIKFPSNLIRHSLWMGSFCPGRGHTSKLNFQSEWRRLWVLILPNQTAKLLMFHPSLRWFRKSNVVSKLELI